MQSSALKSFLQFPRNESSLFDFLYGFTKNRLHIYDHYDILFSVNKLVSYGAVRAVLRSAFFV